MFEFLCFIGVIIVLNVFIWRLVSRPKKIFGKDSLQYKIINKANFKNQCLSLIVKILRPFLVADCVSNLALFLFINTSVIVWFVDASNYPYICNVSYSIIAASIFQYVIYIIPNERQKLIKADDLLFICRGMREREKIWLEILGYNEPVLLSNENHTEIKEKLTSLYKNNPVISEIKCCHNHMSSWNDGSQIINIEKNINFLALKKLLCKHDDNSFLLLKKYDLNGFSNMHFHLLQIQKFLGMKNKLGNDKVEAEMNFIAYILIKRSQLVLSYQKSASNYLMDTDENYHLPYL